MMRPNYKKVLEQCAEGTARVGSAAESRLHSRQTTLDMVGSFGKFALSLGAPQQFIQDTIALGNIIQPGLEGVVPPAVEPSPVVPMPRGKRFDPHNTLG